MVQRLFPLLLALVVAGAPTALAVCQADCAAAAHSSHAHHGANAPACHDDGAGSGARMQGVPQPCSHSDELTATSGAQVQAPAVRALVAVTPWGAPGVAPVPGPGIAWRPGEPNSHASVRHRLTVSLRI
jgi:hypothetical protein